VRRDLFGEHAAVAGHRRADRIGQQPLPAGPEGLGLHRAAHRWPGSAQRVVVGVGQVAVQLGDGRFDEMAYRQPTRRDTGAVAVGDRLQRLG
jgi:hypothetical protein